MSICANNEKVLDLFAARMGTLEEFDHAHAAECSSCKSALEKTKMLQALLDSYATGIDDIVAFHYSEERLAKQVRAKAKGQILLSGPYRWLAVAASLFLAVGIAYLSFHMGRESVLNSPPYIESLKSEAMRAEIHSYLSKSQILLLGLLDQSSNCSDDNSFEREAARRLLLQKRLLEPRLSDSRFKDLRPLISEIGLLLTEVANTEGCFREEEVKLWKRVVESRSTLMKLNLLQMKDRI